MKSLGILLVVLGVAALLFGEIRYSRQQTLVEVGPIKATTTEHHHIPISPLAGGVAIAAGLAMLVAGSRRAS